LAYVCSSPQYPGTNGLPGGKNLSLDRGDSLKQYSSFLKNRIFILQQEGKIM